MAHPRGDALAGALLEGEAEGAVAAVAAFAGQLLGHDGLSGSDDLLVAVDEVVDAQVIDIAVVGDALTGEIHAEVGTVGANGLGQLLQREVVLQVKLCFYAVYLQHLFEMREYLTAVGRLSYLLLTTTPLHHRDGLGESLQGRQRLYSPQQESEEHELDDMQEEDEVVVGINDRIEYH